MIIWSSLRLFPRAYSYFLQLLRFMYNSKKKTINSFDAQNLWLNCIFILKTNTSKIKNLTVKIMLIQNPFLKI